MNDDNPILKLVEEALDLPDTPSDDPKDVLHALIHEADAAIMSAAATGTDPRPFPALFFLVGLVARERIGPEAAAALVKAGPEFPYALIAKRVLAGGKALHTATEAASDTIDRLLMSVGLSGAQSDSVIPLGPPGKVH